MPTHQYKITLKEIFVLLSGWNIIMKFKKLSIVLKSDKNFPTYLVIYMLAQRINYCHKYISIVYYNCWKYDLFVLKLNFCFHVTLYLHEYLSN